MYFLTRKQYDILTVVFAMDCWAGEAYRSSVRHWSITGVTVMSDDSTLCQCFREVGAKKID